MAVDPLFAQWLQSTADTIVRTDTGGTARWGTSALTTERTTAIAKSADAAIEADRQLAFFARGPFAVDVHEIVGIDWLPYIGKVVTLTNDQLGYAAGVDVLLTGVESDRATGISTLTVVRPLKGVA